MSHYNYFDEKKCDALRFNYYPGSVDGEYPERYEERHVGYGQVVDIIEHYAAGEGDKHFFDVVFDNGRVERVFHPHVAYYSLVCPKCKGEGSYEGKTGGSEGIPEADVMFVCNECKGTGKINKQ